MKFFCFLIVILYQSSYAQEVRWQEHILTASTQLNNGFVDKASKYFKSAQQTIPIEFSVKSSEDFYSLNGYLQIGFHTKNLSQSDGEFLKYKDILIDYINNGSNSKSSITEKSYLTSSFLQFGLVDESLNILLSIEKYLKINEKSDSIEFAQNSYNLGVVSLLKNQLKRSELYFEKSKNIYDSLNQTGTFEYFQVISGLSKIYGLFNNERDYLKSIQFIENYYKLSPSNRDLYLLNFYQEIGFFFYNHQKKEKANSVFNKAYNHFTKNTKSYKYYKPFLINKLNAFIDEKDIEGLKNWYPIFKELIIERNDYDSVSIRCDLLAINLFYQTSNWKLLEKHIPETLVVLPQSDDNKDLELLLKKILRNAYFENEDYLNSSLLTNELIKIYISDKWKNEKDYFDNRIYKVRILIKQRKAKEALEVLTVLETEIEDLNEIDLHEAKVNVYNKYVETHELQNDSNNAVRYLKNILSLYEDGTISRNKEFVKTITKLSFVLSERRRINELGVILKKYEDFFKKSNFKSSFDYYFFLFNLGNFYKENGNNSLSIDYYKKSYQVCSTFDCIKESRFNVLNRLIKQSIKAKNIVDARVFLKDYKDLVSGTRENIKYDILEIQCDLFEDKFGPAKELLDANLNLFDKNAELKNDYLYKNFQFVYDQYHKRTNNSEKINVDITGLTDKAKKTGNIQSAITRNELLITMAKFWKSNELVIELYEAMINFLGQNEIYDRRFKETNEKFIEFLISTKQFDRAINLGTQLFFVYLEDDLNLNKFSDIDEYGRIALKIAKSKRKSGKFTEAINFSNAILQKGLIPIKIPIKPVYDTIQEINFLLEAELLEEKAKNLEAQDKKLEAATTMLAAYNLLQSKLGVSNEYGIRFLFDNLEIIFYYEDEKILSDLLKEANNQIAKKINEFDFTGIENQRRFLLKYKSLIDKIHALNFHKIFDLSKMGLANSIKYKGLVLRNKLQNSFLVDSLNMPEINVLKGKYKNINKDLLNFALTKNQRDSLKKLQFSVDDNLSKKIKQYKKQSLSSSAGDLYPTNDILKEHEVYIEYVRFKDTWDKNSGYKYMAYIFKPNQPDPSIVNLFDEKALKNLIENSKDISSIYSKRGSRAVGASQLSVRDSIFKMVWHPLKNNLQSVENIYYSPDGLLHQISFTGLTNTENKYISNEYNLSQVSSIRKIAKEKKQLNYKSAVVLGNVNYEDDYEMHENKNFKSDSTFDIAIRGWSNLEGTENEINELESIFSKRKMDITILDKNDASEENIKKLDKDSPDIIHIATHGFFYKKALYNDSLAMERGKTKFEARVNRILGIGEAVQNDSIVNQYLYDLKNNNESFLSASDPLIRSGLILAGGNYAWVNGKAHPGKTEDGILTALEISNMDLSNTDLVVLSACDTGLGDINGSEGVYGLQRAFKMAGVDMILMTLWPIPDKETPEFMQKFYTDWLGEGNIREAFKNAQIFMQKEYPDNPEYWAGFVLLQ